MRTLTIASVLALLAACSPNPSPQPMGMQKPDASKPQPPRPEEPKAKAPEEPAVKKFRVSMSDEEWRQKLTPEQFEVCRMKGTERPFGKIYEEFEKQGKGSYVCVACGKTLFKSDTKFHSGSGWPSFFAPLDDKSVEKLRDFSHGMDRVEVHCGDCGAHLGHVFDDGPRPTGLRYCINGVALKFDEEKK